MKVIKKIDSYLQQHKTVALMIVSILSIILLLLFLTTKTDGITTKDPVPSLAVDASQNFSSDVRGIQTEDADAIVNSSDTSTSSTQVADENKKSDNNDEVVEYTQPDLSSVKIQADAAVVWDVETNSFLYEKNSEQEMPLASITKLMTALVAAESLESVDDEEITITRQHLDAYGNRGLVAGQTWNIRDLISFMLMSSANDAARAIASFASDSPADGYYAKAFIEDMNDKARELNLESTYFFNPSGLDLNETLISGGYGNARDVARLFGYILNTNQGLLEPTTVSSRVFQSNEGVTYSSHNTNSKLSLYSNILGSKTGYTVLAGGNLVMGFQLNNPVVIVVLGSTQNGRFTDMEMLYNATKQHFGNTDTMSNNSTNF